MGLKNLRLPTETIPIPGDTLTLRGLSLPDLTILVRVHGNEIAPLIGIIQKALVAEGAEINVSLIGRAVLDLSPNISGEIIALAAGEPDCIPEALSLPFPTQIVALEKIAKLTFEQEGGLANFIETLTRIFQEITSASDSLLATENGSIAGSEVSAAA